MPDKAQQQVTGASETNPTSQPQIDVLDYVLENGADPKAVVESFPTTSEFVINPPEYYYEKYSIESNPNNPNALSKPQIDQHIKQMKVLKSYQEGLKAGGYSAASFVDKERVESVRARTGGKIWMPDANLVQDSDALKDVYTGATNPLSGASDIIGTQEEIAETSPYMFVERTQADGTIKREQIPMLSQEELDKQFGDGKAVVTTTNNELDNNRPVLIVKDKDSYVPNEQVYSTSYGARKTYSDSPTSDWFKKAWNEIYATMPRGLASMSAMTNDELRFDKYYIFEQGDEAVNAHYQKLRDQLYKDGNVKAIDQLDNAMKTNDYQTMANAFQSAYLNIKDKNAGKQLSYEAQPIDFVAADKIWQNTDNKFTGREFNDATDMTNLEGWKGLIYESAPIFAQMVPQVAVGYLTGGLSIGAQATTGIASKALTAASWTSKAFSAMVETSQVLGSTYSAWEDAGVDPEMRARMGLAVASVTYASSHLLGGWMQSKLTPEMNGVYKEIFGEAAIEFAKKHGRAATDAEIKSWAGKQMSKMIQNETFQKFVNSDRFFPTMIKDVSMELGQESLEQMGQNTTELINDKYFSDEFDEVGKGKIGTESVFQGMGDVTAQTVFSTAIISMVSGGIPRMYKRAIGMPETDTDAQQRKAIEWQILRGKGQDILGWAEKEIAKEDGAFGNKAWKIKDALIEGEEPSIFVPKSAKLQSMGYEEGARIDNMADMRFIELVTQIEKVEELNATLGLNDIDRHILSQLGITGSQELSGSIRAYEALLDSKAALESYQPKEGATETEIASDKEKLQADYDKAKLTFDYHTKREEGVESGNTKAINDIVKRNSTLKKQVDARVASMPEFNGQDADALKNNPDFVNRYTNVWQDEIAKSYGYDNIEAYRKVITEQQQAQIQARQNALAEMDDNSIVMNAIDTQLQATLATIEQAVDLDTALPISQALKDLDNVIMSKASNLNAENLAALKDKHSQALDQARAKVGQFLQDDVAKKDKVVDDNLDATVQEIDNKIAEQEAILAQLNEVDPTTLNEVELSERDNAISKANNAITSYNETKAQEIEQADAKKEMNYEDMRFDDFKAQYGAKNDIADVIDSLGVDINERLAEQRKQASSDASLIDSFFNDAEGMIKEIDSFISSVLNGDDNYNEEYKGRARLDASNAMQSINSLATELEALTKLQNAFKTAKVISGDKKIEKHSSQEEIDFVKEMASKDGEYDERITRIKNELDTLKERSGMAQATMERGRIHNRTLIQENTLQSLKLIASMKLMDGTSILINSDLAKKIIDMQMLSDNNPEILEAKGNYDEATLLLLAQREKVMNDFMSDLQSKRDKIFNDDTNMRIITDIFFAMNASISKGEYPTIFMAEDGAAHSSNGRATTTESRELISTVPFKDANGRYFFDGATKFNRAQRIMKMREFMNVLMWIDAPKSINEVMAVRRAMYEEGKYELETGEQEAVVNSAISFITSGSNNIITKVFDFMDSFNEGNAKHKPGEGRMTRKDATFPNGYFTNSLTIGGDYGVGKTQFVLPRAFEIIKRLYGSDSNKYKFVSITEKLQEVHKDSFASQTKNSADYISLTELLSNLDKMPAGVNDVYVIDEASIISEKEHNQLRDWVAKNGNKAKVIFLGDTFQMRSRDSKGYAMCMLRSVNTHMLSEQFSSSSPLLRQLTSVARQSILSLDKPVDWDSVAVKEVIGKDGNKQGARYFLSKNEVVASFLSDIDAHPNRALIFSSREQLEAFKKNNPNYSEALKNNENKIFFALRNTNGSTADLMQGLREKEVYVALSEQDRIDDKISPKLLASAFYTAIGRASNWVGLVGPLKGNDATKAADVGVNVSDTEFKDQVRKRFRTIEATRFSVYPKVEDKKAAPVKGQKKTNAPITPSTNSNSFFFNYDVPGTSDKYKIEYSFKPGPTIKGVTKYFVDIIINGPVVQKVSKSIDINADVNGDALTDKIMNLVEETVSDEIDFIFDDIETPMHSVTTNGHLISLGDNVVLKNGNSAVVQDIIYKSDKGIVTQTITVLSEKGKLEEVNVSNGRSVEIIPFNDETVLETESDIMERVSTESTRQYTQNKDRGEAHWVSTATVVDATTSDATEVRKIRTINDAIGNEIANKRLPGATVVLGKLGTRNGITGFGSSASVAAFDTMVPVELIVTPQVREALNSIPHINTKEVNWNDRVVNGRIAIGSLGEVKIPTIVKETDTNGKKRDVIIYNQTATSLEAIDAAWNKVLKHNNKSGVQGLIDENRVKEAIETAKSLFNLREQLKNNEKVIADVTGNSRRITYSSNVNGIQVLSDFLFNNNAKVISSTPIYSKNRMRVNIQLVTGEVMSLVVNMPLMNSNPQYKIDLDGAVSKEQSTVQDAYNKAKSDVNKDVEALERVIDTAFFNTSLAKFLRGNISIIGKGGNAWFKSTLAQYIKVTADGKIDLIGSNNNAKLLNYDNAVKALLASDYGSMVGISSTLIREGEKMVTFSGESDIESMGLTTRAEYIGNIQMYALTNSDINEDEKIVNIESEEDYDDINNAYEGIPQQSKELQSIDAAINEVKARLGEDYINSAFFMVQDGMMQDNKGNEVFGMVSNNSLMRLASLSGQIPTSTAKHEVFHVVFRNFVKLDKQQDLKEAARYIAMKEQGKDITGNEEEWMARDYGNRKVYEGNDDNTSLWNRFKGFIKRIIPAFSKLYGKRAMVEKMYRDIDNGLFVDKVENLSVTTEANIAYEQQNDLGAPEIPTEAEVAKYDNNKLTLKNAYDTKNYLAAKSMRNESIVIAQNLLQLQFVNRTNYGLLKGHVVKDFATTVDEVLSYAKNRAETLGKAKVTLIDGTEMTIGQVVRLDRQSDIDFINSANGNANKINDLKRATDVVMIYSNEENVRALLQVIAPSMNFDKGEFGQAGVIDGYNWENIMWTDNVADMHKLFLSSILRINALGKSGRSSRSPIISKAAALEQMKMLGQSISRDGKDSITELKALMEAIIDKGTINKKNEFTDEQTEIVHSIYNALFGARGNAKVEGYKLDYSAQLNGASEFQGLQEKIDSQRKSFNQRVRYENGRPVLTPELIAERKQIQDAENFLTGLVNSFTSTYTKKLMITEFDGDVTKTRMFDPEKWVDEALSINNSQSSKIRGGKLDDNAASVFNHLTSVQFENGSPVIYLRSNTSEQKTPSLIYGNGKFTFIQDGKAITKVSKIDDVRGLLNNLERIKGLLGLNGISSNTLEGIFTAKTWAEASNQIRQISSLGYFANNFSLIMDSYATPLDFFADYIGTTMTMYNAYAGSYKMDFTSADGTKVVQTAMTVNELMKTDLIEDAREQRLSSIPGSNVIESFISKVTPKAQRTEDVTTDEVSIDDSQNAEEITKGYYTPSQWKSAHSLMATIIEKMENVQAARQVYNAKGTLTSPISQVTTLSRAMDNNREAMNKASDAIQIVGVVESAGTKRNVGITSIGTTKVDTSDYVRTAVDTFFNEISRTKANPNMFVPSTTASDTGKMNYINATSTIINLKGDGFDINWNAIAGEFDYHQEKHNEVIRQSRKRFDDFVTLLNAQVKGTIIAPPMIGDKSRFTQGRIKGYFDALNSQDAATKEAIRNIIDQSGMVVNPYTSKAFGDIAYTQGENGELTFVAGALLTDRVNGRRMYSKGTKENTLLRKAVGLMKEGKSSEAQLLLMDNSLFGEDLVKFFVTLSNANYKPSKQLSEYNSKSISGNYLVSDKNYYEENEKRTGIAKVNAPLFAYYMSTFLINQRVNLNTGINVYSFGDYISTVKRSGPINTPGMELITGTYSSDGVREMTLPAKSKIIPVHDTFVKTGEVFELDENGNEIFTDKNSIVNSEDGELFVNPFYRVLMLNSFGGDKNTIIGKSKMYKGLTNATREDGTFSQLKRADSNISNNDMQYSAFRNRFILLMKQSDILLKENGVEDFSFFDSFQEKYDASTDKNMERIVEEIIFEQYQLQYNENGTVNRDAVKRFDSIINSVIANISPVAVQKGSLKNLNTVDFTLPIDEAAVIALDEYSNVDTKVIMNPAQEVNTNKMQAAPAQLEAFFGVASTVQGKALAGEYHATKELLQQEQVNELNTEISKTAVNGVIPEKGKRFNDIDWLSIDLDNLTDEQRANVDSALSQLDQYGRERNINSLAATGQDLAYIELMSNPDVSSQLPMMRAKLKQSYLNMVNDTIQGRVHGLRVTQTSGVHVELYDNGTITLDMMDALKYAGYDITSISLSMMTDGSIESVLASAGFTKRGLKDMAIDENGNTTMGEVVMPNIFADKYGHKDTDTMLDVQSVKVLGNYIMIKENGYDLLTRMPFSTFQKYVQLAITNPDVDIDKFYAEFLDSPMIRKAISNLQAKDNLPTDINELRNALNSMENYEAIIKETSELLETFNNGMERLLSRVPANSMAAGSILRTVSFANGIGNVAYIPVGMTNRNDSDFDIDALTDYAASIGPDGKLSNKPSDKLRNKLADLRKQIYMSKDYQKAIFTKSSSVSSREGKKGEVLSDTLTSIFNTYDQNKAGADAIGKLANSMNALSFMLSFDANTKTGSSSMLSDILSKEQIGEIQKVNKMGVESIIQRLGKWLQTAMDNAKNNSMGSFGITPETVNLAAVMAANNYSADDIYDFFNNPFVRDLIDKYSVRSSLMQKTSDYDMYTMAINEASKMSAIMKNMSKDDIVEAMKKVTGDSSITIETLGYDSNSPSNTIEAMNGHIEMLDSAINDVVRQYLSKPSIGTKVVTVTDSQVADFRYKNKMNDWALSNRFNKGKLEAKQLFDEIEDMPQDIIDSLYNYGYAYNRASSLRDIASASKVLSQLPPMALTADTMYRLSNIIGKRTGLQVIDADILNEVNTFELMMGMDLKDFVSNDIPSSLDIVAHMEYWRNNNESYRAEKDVNKKASMEIKEQMVVSQFNLPYFVKNTPQLNHIVEEMYRQQSIGEQQFFIEHPVVKEILNGFLERQNRGRLSYGNQLAAFNNAVYSLALDKFYNERNESKRMIGSMSVPYKTTGNVWTTISFSNLLDLGSVYERGQFVQGFPSYVQALQSNIDDVEFLRLLLPEEHRDFDFTKLSENAFLKRIVIGGAMQDTIKLSGNTRNMQVQEIAKLKDSFSELPQYMQELFTNYEIIHNRMNYRQGGIMQILGTDFYKGDISRIFNSISKDIKSGNAETFITRDGVTMEQLTETLYDYLGMQPELAVYKSEKEFKLNEVDAPMYVYNTKKENGFSRTFNYKHMNGQYYPMFTVSRFGGVSGANQSTVGNVSSFVAPQTQIDIINQNGTGVYIGNSKWAVPGKYYYLSNTVGFDGMPILVKVKKVEGVRFTFEKATIADGVTTTEFLDKQMAKDREKLSNRTSIMTDKLIEGIFSPKNVVDAQGEVKTTVILEDSVLSKLTDVNGKQIFVPGVEYKSVFSMLNEAKTSIYGSITDVKVKKNMDFAAWNRIEASLRLELQKAASSDKAPSAKQLQRINEIQVAMAKEFEMRDIIVSAVLEQRMSEAIAGNEGIVKKINNILLDENTLIDSEYETMVVGNKTYGELVRTAIKQMVFGKSNATVVAENARLENISTFDAATVLFTKKSNSEYRMMTDKELEAQEKVNQQKLKDGEVNNIEANESEDSSAIKNCKK